MAKDITTIQLKMVRGVMEMAHGMVIGPPTPLIIPYLSMPTVMVQHLKTSVLQTVA